MTATLRQLRFAVRNEFAIWRSLLRWAFRRPERLRPGDQAFTGAGAMPAMMWVLVGLSALEILALELLLPWAAARHFVLGFGTYCLLYLLGLLAAHQVHPHVVGDAGLRVRKGVTFDLTIAWASIDTIRVSRRPMPQADQAHVVSLGAAGQTNIDLLLRKPATVSPRPARGLAVTDLRFHADDPEALVAAVRARLTGYPPRSVPGPTRRLAAYSA